MSALTKRELALALLWAVALLLAPGAQPRAAALPRLLEPHHSGMPRDTGAAAIGGTARAGSAGVAPSRFPIVPADTPAFAGASARQRSRPGMQIKTGGPAQNKAPSAPPPAVLPSHETAHGDAHTRPQSPAHGSASAHADGAKAAKDRASVGNASTAGRTPVEGRK